MREKDWLVDGYSSYIKRRKKKSSRKLFYRHITKHFADQGIDIRYPTCIPILINEIFWQIRNLKIREKK